jgi:uncharacterized surface protein with fasciclin (FAS1) repeats
MLKKFKTSIFLAVLVLAAAGLQSCGGEEPSGPKPTKSIFEYMTDEGNFKDFLAAADRAGLTAKISGSGSMTFLIVTDEQLAIDNVDLSAMSDQEVTDFMNYHMMGSKKTFSDIVNNNYTPSEAAIGPGGAKLSLYTEVTGNAVTYNGEAATKNYEATNGMIYVLAGNLNPPTLMDHLAINENLTNYLSGINLEAALKTVVEGNNVTIFGYNEKQLVDWMTGHQSIRISNLKPSLRRAILANTIVKGKVLTSTTMTGTTTTEGNKDMTFATSGSTITVNGTAKVIRQNIYGKNGILHIIDGVLED